MTEKQLKLHKTAPLPFVGQKRNFIKHFISVLNGNIDGDGQDWTIVDAFGGSGLLSHVAKRIKPQATVIYNDFDDYHERLQHIDETNRLRQALVTVLDGKIRDKKLDSETKQSVINCIEDFDGYVDMRAISSWVLFSGKHANTVEELYKATLYNVIRRSDYQLIGDYLQGLKRVKMDFEGLLNKHKYNEKALFVLDPPYICTQQGMYANKSYFGMVEFLRLMRAVRPPFIFFSSTRSELIDYLDFVINNKAEGYKEVENYKHITIESRLNATAKYEDNLVLKF